VPSGFGRGAEFTTWSYNVRPAPRRLNASRPVYSPLLDRFLIIDSRRSRAPTPTFGSPNRAAEMEAFFDDNFSARWYGELYDTALEVAGDAPTPYAAAVALESWFRDSGEFRYAERPRLEGNAPVLVEFVTTAREGYCQHYAGAMALMLRYLGIPARVAAGFTSGSYDQDDGRWKVTDHNAHLWVEVWFRGFGWIPFDPTPGRGQLDGAYSTASINFNAAAVAAALAATPGVPNFRLQTGQFEGVNRPDRGQQRDLPGDLGGGSVVSDPEESLLRLLALLTVALLLLVMLVKLGLRRLRYVTRNPRKLAAACRRELADYLVDQRIPVPESATVTELGEIVRHQTAVDPESFVEAVNTARYGPAYDADAAARRARRELRRIERMLRGRLSIWERLRGLVSLRSLGLTGG
jgi:transglutaminase-like putative cysteine protease